MALLPYRERNRRMLDKRGRREWSELTVAHVSVSKIRQEYKHQTKAITKANGEMTECEERSKSNIMNCFI